MEGIISEVHTVIADIKKLEEYVTITSPTNRTMKIAGEALATITRTLESNNSEIRRVADVSTKTEEFKAGIAQLIELQKVLSVDFSALFTNVKSWSDDAEDESDDDAKIESDHV